MRTFKTLGSAIVVTLVLVMSLDYAASAATGHPFILGKVNKANKATAVKRTTAGPALSLTTRSAADAPFAVNGHGTVVNLNADSVDGNDASALRTHSYVWHSTFAGRTWVSFVLPLPPGSYLVTYSSLFGGLGVSSLECAVVEANPSSLDRFTARSAIYNGDTTFTPSLTGAGMVTKAAGGNISVTCGTNGHPFSTSASSPFEIVATPTTVVGSGSLYTQDN